MILPLLVSAALAGDGSVRVALPTGATVTTVFAATSLETVGTVTAAKVTYTIRCGTLSRVRTCAAYDGANREVARTTNIQSSDTDGFAMTYGDGDGFVFHTITWTVR